MTIAVIGSGAMGSLFGGRLAAAGHEVILYDVFEQHVAAVNRDGLTIETVDGAPLMVRLRATTDPAQTAGADVYIVFVKSNATRAVAAQFAALVGDHALVVTMQNGLGNAEILAEYFGDARTAAGVTSQGATFVGPGRIRHAGRGPSHLCMRNKRNELLKPFCDALNAAGLEAHIDPDIDNLIWSKLVINVGINALTALTGQENGKLANHAGTKTLMAELVAEAVAVAKALGITLSHADPLATTLEIAAKTGANRSSMLQDFDRKRESEIDVINAAVVRAGERVGIPTPYNRAIELLVRTMDEIHVAAPA